MRCNKKNTGEKKMRVLLALTIAAVVFAAGAYSIVRSVDHPATDGTYSAYTTGASSRIDWSDRFNAGFDE
jgi:multidrug resistance efflux pump